MIAYAIVAALSSKVFDRVIVNSDSDVFRSIAEEYGAEFYLRPEHLGGSSVKSDDVVKDFIDKYHSVFELSLFKILFRKKQLFSLTLNLVGF